MKHKSKKWMLQTKRADFRKISEKFGISPVLARCIVNREVQEEEIGNYIQADWRQTWRRRCRFCGKIEKN